MAKKKTSFLGLFLCLAVVVLTLIAAGTTFFEDFVKTSTTFEGGAIDAFISGMSVVFAGEQNVKIIGTIGSITKVSLLTFDFEFTIVPLLALAFPLLGAIVLLIGNFFKGSKRFFTLIAFVLELVGSVMVFFIIESFISANGIAESINIAYSSGLIIATISILSATILTAIKFLFVDLKK